MVLSPPEQRTVRSVRAGVDLWKVVGHRPAEKHILDSWARQLRSQINLARHAYGIKARGFFSSLPNAR